MKVSSEAILARSLVCFFYMKKEVAICCDGAFRPKTGRWGVGLAFYEMDDGKVCAGGACLQRYREAAAPKCLMCSAPILASYFEVDSLDGSGKGKVCAEGDCLQRFKRSA